MAEEPSPNNPYDIVIADLKAKRDQLDVTIASLEAARGPLVNAVQRVTQNHSGDAPEAVRPGAFFGMSIAEAAKQFLASRKSPMGNTDITDALIAGGVVFSGDTPVNTVGSVLHRQANKVGDVVNVGRGKWGLATWYTNPGRFQKKKAAVGESDGSEGLEDILGIDPKKG